MAEEDLVSFFTEKPHMFYILKEKELMAILKDLYNGGLTISEVLAKHEVNDSQVSEWFEKLLRLRVIERIQEDDDWRYFLSFDGKKMIDLYNSSKQSL
jgi:DNA-binding transcriptional ArsR family regulator